MSTTPSRGTGLRTLPLPDSPAAIPLTQEIAAHAAHEESKDGRHGALKDCRGRGGEKPDEVGHRETDQRAERVDPLRVLSSRHGPLIVVQLAGICAESAHRHARPYQELATP
jgi:hypothetical protein